METGTRHRAVIDKMKNGVMESKEKNCMMLSLSSKLATLQIYHQSRNDVVNGIALHESNRDIVLARGKSPTTVVDADIASSSFVTATSAIDTVDAAQDSSPLKKPEASKETMTATNNETKTTSAVETATSNRKRPAVDDTATTNNNNKKKKTTKANSEMRAPSAARPIRSSRTPRAPEGKWSCRHCTLFNTLRSRKCAGCGNEKLV